jgi:hypothetical protein
MSFWQRHRWKIVIGALVVLAVSSVGIVWVPTRLHYRRAKSLVRVLETHVQLAPEKRQELQRLLDEQLGHLGPSHREAIDALREQVRNERWQHVRQRLTGFFNAPEAQRAKVLDSEIDKLGDQSANGGPEGVDSFIAHVHGAQDAPPPQDRELVEKFLQAVNSRRRERNLAPLD